MGVDLRGRGEGRDFCERVVTHCAFFKKRRGISSASSLAGVAVCSILSGVEDSDGEGLRAGLGRPGERFEAVIRDVMVRKVKMLWIMILYETLAA
jgi:hypothetical protein